MATDIAARGIDVKDMSLVVNYDLPEDPETYVHRIGRTARAEADGEAVSFCSADDAPLLKAIEKFIRKQIDPLADNPFHSEAAQKAGTLKTSLVEKLAQPLPKSKPQNGGGKRPQGGRRQKPQQNQYYGESLPRKKGKSAQAVVEKIEGKKSAKKIGGMLKRKMKAAGFKPQTEKPRGKSAKTSFWQKLRESLRK